MLENSLARCGLDTSPIKKGRGVWREFLRGRVRRFEALSRRNPRDQFFGGGRTRAAPRESGSEVLAFEVQQAKKG